MGSIGGVGTLGFIIALQCFRFVQRSDSSPSATPFAVLVIHPRRPQKGFSGVALLKGKIEHAILNSEISTTDTASENLLLGGERSALAECFSKMNSSPPPRGEKDDCGPSCF